MTICLHIWVFTLTEPVHSFCYNRYQGKSREQTTFWCVLRTVTLKMRHRSWIRCWASIIPSSAAFGAERVLLAAINYSRSLVTFDIIWLYIVIFDKLQYNQKTVELCTAKVAVWAHTHTAVFNYSLLTAKWGVSMENPVVSKIIELLEERCKDAFSGLKGKIKLCCIKESSKRKSLMKYS